MQRDGMRIERCVRSGHLRLCHRAAAHSAPARQRGTLPPSAAGLLKSLDGRAPAGTVTPLRAVGRDSFPTELAKEAHTNGCCQHTNIRDRRHDLRRIRREGRRCDGAAARKLDANQRSQCDDANEPLGKNGWWSVLSAEPGIGLADADPASVCDQRDVVAPGRTGAARGQGRGLDAPGVNDQLNSTVRYTKRMHILSHGPWPLC